MLANRKTPTLATAALLFAAGYANATTTIDPIEDVMTSPFFFGPNFVRGYDPDNRLTHRVSTPDPFGIPGSETIYIQFDPADFAGLSQPVPQATLSMESVFDPFEVLGDATNPFTMSAHAVSADPITTIIDDTNPGGTQSFTAFFDTQILPADPAALTDVPGLGTVEFDVTSIVNDWLAGSNTQYFIAITGLNETTQGLGGNGFQQGFLNNTETPGSTVLTVIPEPGTAALLAAACLGMVRRRR